MELLEILIDGPKVKPTLVAPKAKWGAYQDYYHTYHMARPVAGRHNATAMIRVLADRAESSHTIEFSSCRENLDVDFSAFLLDFVVIFF